MSNTIKTIIFSKNRAPQLDLLISSLKQNGKEFLNDVDVIYKATTKEFQDGYNKCQDYHCDLHIDFIPEKDFRENTLESIAYHSHKYTIFFVDDNILFRPLNFDMSILNNLFNQGINTLSLRLGRNVTIQDPYTGQNSNLPSTFYQYEQFYIWNIKDVRGFSNYNYSISLDGNIYLTEQINQAILDTEFTNPNFLEGNIQKYHNRFPVMACLEHSVIINSPNNRVQDIFTNRNAEHHPLSLIETNHKFLDGYRFQLNKIDFSNIQACHTELDLIMEKI